MKSASELNGYREPLEPISQCLSDPIFYSDTGGPSFQTPNGKKKTSMPHEKPDTLIKLITFLAWINLHSVEDHSFANDHSIEAAVCLLITIFLEWLETICPEGTLRVLEWVKHHFISCDNISFVIAIHGRQLSTRQEGIGVGGSSRWCWRWGFGDAFLFILSNKLIKWLTCILKLLSAPFHFN